MDMKKTTFSLEELNSEFWGNVLLVNIQHSTGMGGWGCLWIVTKDPKLYFIGFEGFPYDERKLYEFAPLFKKSKNPQHQYDVEENGWKYIGDRKILIRVDFYDSFMKFYEEEDRWARGGYHYLHVPDVAARALGVEKLERYDYKAAENMEKTDIKQLKEKELTTDDFIWKTLYPNNQKTMFENGEYALIFKECDEKVAGYRFSIVYQRTEITPLCFKSLHEIEAYNLYEKKYDDVQGALYYKDVEEHEFGYGWFGEPEHTLNQYEINDFGAFVRSFKTMEDAKEYVVKRTNLLRYVNNDNLITDLEDTKREYKNRLRQCEAINAFGKHYEEILRVLNRYDYPCGNCEKEYLFEEIRSQTSLDMQMLKEMWKYIPFVLCRRTQEYSQEVALKCRAKLGLPNHTIGSFHGMDIYILAENEDGAVLECGFDGKILRMFATKDGKVEIIHTTMKMTQYEYVSKCVASHYMSYVQNIEK